MWKSAKIVGVKRSIIWSAFDAQLKRMTTSYILNGFNTSVFIER